MRQYLFKKISSIVLLAFFLNSCASYTTVSLPQKDVTTLHQYEKQNNVHVGVSFMDKTEVQRYFDADLIKEFLDALHRGSQIIPSPLRGEG